MKKGPLTKQEKTMLQAVDPRADVAETARTLAPILERTPEALRKAIRDARELLVSRSSQYVELHQEAAARAAKRGDARPAQWALEHVSMAGERIVEPAPQAAAVNVGVQVVLPTFAAPLVSQNPALPAHPENFEVDALDAQLLPVERPRIEGESAVVCALPVRNPSESA
jgi:predicted component of type VI protein secretion system